jgi:hypothetical protein
MSSEDQAAILAFAIELAEKASKMILEGSNKRWTQSAERGGEVKGNAVDVSVCFSATSAW